MKFSKRLLMEINSLIRSNVFGRRYFIHLLFDVEVVEPPSIQSYCEWPTILLRFIMKRYVWPGARILDIGTGAHAILAIFIQKYFPDMAVLATDILPERISCAQKTVAKNNVNVVCMVADMFEGIEGKFDLILFNPPAIPTSELEELGFELKIYPNLGSRRCWSGDGGRDGLDEIRAFLNKVKEHLNNQGRAILSVNPSHCGTNLFNSLCREKALVIKRVHKFPGITNAYVLASE